MQQDDAAPGASHRMPEVGRVAHLRRVGEGRVPQDQVLEPSGRGSSPGVHVVGPVWRTEQGDHGSAAHLPEDPLGAGDLPQLARVGERGHLWVRDRVVRDPEAARRDGAPGRRRAREDTGIWEVRRGNVPRLQDVCDAPTVGRVVPVVDRERDVRSGPRPVVDDARHRGLGRRWDQCAQQQDGQRRDENPGPSERVDPATHQQPLDDPSGVPGRGGRAEAPVRRQIPPHGHGVRRRGVCRSP